MKILVIGSGGREHALVWKLSKSEINPEIICIPGNAGISKLAKCVDGDISNIKNLTEFAIDNNIDLTIVGPELPLSLGIVDEFEKAGLRIFGPNKEAAKLESSKIWAKTLLSRKNIPTPQCIIASDFKSAKKYISALDCRYVIKADGLAAGKGVYICNNYTDGENALKEIMIDKKFGDSGNSVIIENFKDGFEMSLMMFVSNSRKILPLLPVMDYKKLHGDINSKNTGGLGSVCPHPFITADLYNKIRDNIIMPTVCGLIDLDIKYTGILYIGLMISDEDPYVLEYNVRFGDPECQPLMMLLKSDIIPIINSCIDGTLTQNQIEWKDDNAICVVAYSEGYPGNYDKGFEINGLDDINNEKVEVFHGGTKLLEDKIVTSGGRVLSITTNGNTYAEATRLAYETLHNIRFSNMNFRKDIGT